MLVELDQRNAGPSQIVVPEQRSQRGLRGIELRENRWSPLSLRSGLTGLKDPRLGLRRFGVGLCGAWISFVTSGNGRLHEAGDDVVDVAGQRDALRDGRR